MRRRREEEAFQGHIAAVKNGEGLSVALPDKGYKLGYWRFRLNVGRKFLTVGVTGLWDRIPKGAVGSPALETFRTQPAHVPV